MSARALGNARGLTLAEILVATAVIAIGLVGLAVVVPVASYGVQEGNQLSTATFLAEQRIEQARNRPWTLTPANDCLGVSAGNAQVQPTIPAGGACTTPALGAGTATFADENPVTGFTGYSRTTWIWDCATVDCAGLTTPGASMRLITVTVSYRPLTGAGVAVTNKSVVIQWAVARR